MPRLAGVLRAGLIVLGVGALVARRRLVAVTVVGESMAPTLHAGDRVLVARTSLRGVRRRQVVVFAHPGGAVDDPPWLVKRVVALPGDVVPESVPGLAGDRVPAGRFVVLGDNAAKSLDSRRVGHLPADALLGVVLRRLRG